MTEAEQRLEAAIGRVAEALSDQFDLDDIAVIVQEAVEVAEVFEKEITSNEKKDLAVAFLDTLIDRFFTTASPSINKVIEDLDLPGPEWLERAAWDPMLRKLAPGIIKPILKKAMPSLVDLVISAHNGKLKLNKPEN